jgi:hypothetical protein
MGVPYLVPTCPKMKEGPVPFGDRTLFFRSLRTNCGADRDRTDDLLHAMQALSQLSYSPIHYMCVPKLLGQPSRCWRGQPQF